ncbi:autotransporter outer membrane beta-barrel domain-containing protein [Actinobacillus porcinus]|uniref:autotransporter outer membrane beta-barrel domain-containing protein n=1 Tax=Actinobacillus porcinus TaxID=51048 RepID=UPI002354D91B|nr:autotransporter outer membrane beta-barrel domain-containing protein [Actinobacillus porcinus]MCI5763615.1 autotransporter outer membrane beta-barrel domain-containing protein [Actinobacillus porcinus]MDY5421545.1 autotransporter outer membrane beta-barrel domain-containing protein [Actinobacillus porcinus]
MYYNRIWFQSLENNLNIADSNLSITSEIEDQGAELINAQNATVNITNSKFSAKLGMGETLNFQNVTGTITDSVFTTALNSDYSYANIISVSKGSNLTINNTTFSASGDVSAIAFEDGNNKVTLNNVTINSEQVLNTFWNTVNSTEYTNLDLTINNSNINSQLFSVATPYNEEDSITNIETLNIVAQNSTLSGVIAMPNGVSEQSSYNLVLNNSSWTTAAQNYTDAESGVTEFFSNKLTNLTLNSGTVNLEKVDNFQTLTVGNLSGTGNFTLNTDLANQQSDKIIVKGSDSGSFGLNIKDSGNEPKAANGKVTLVETATGKATFTLLGNGYVDAGAYRYRLVRDGNNWVLFNQSGEQASSSTSANQGSSQSSTNAGSNAGTGTSSGSGSTATPQVALSEKSNALVSLRQAQLALVESNLEGLHQRLGELKNGEKGNVWVRNVNSRNKFDSTRTASDSHSSGFEQDVHSVQLGADAALTDNIRLGGFVGNARSDVDFDGEYGSGKVKTQSLGLYGTYLANNGFYWDNVAKYEYVKSESASTGKRKYNAYTLSTEVGRIHQLGQGWTVTPQIQAAWTRLSSQSDEERLSALTARAGVRVAKAIEFDGWKLQPYAEVNGITTQTNNNQVRVNQHRFEVSNVEEGKGRFQTALGINAAVGNHRFGLEGSITNGKYLDQPYKVQAVYRYSW